MMIPENPNIKLNDFCEIKDSKINFILQDGPREARINGGQIEDLIRLVFEIMHYFNEFNPSFENRMALANIKIAENWLMKLKEDRELRLRKAGLELDKR